MVLAGANGVGKTTFARFNLSAFMDQQAFLNADDLARAVNPADVESAAVEAARKLLGQRRRLLQSRQSFCIETTLATRTLLRFLREASHAGYNVRIVFLFTPSPDVNEIRVKQRVMAGGHNIETDTIRRRHRLGLKYLATYWDACSEGIIFDTRSLTPVEILRKDGQGTRVLDRSRHSLLLESVRAAGGDPVALA